jgi:hypothetical protein
LLEELCTAFGYCLPADRRAELASDPPGTAGEFLEAVIRAEALEPAAIPRAESAAMLRRVRAAYGELSDA